MRRTLGGCSPPNPAASIPSGKGRTREGSKENAERLLTTNSLFMDTGIWFLSRQDWLLPNMLALPGRTMLVWIARRDSLIENDCTRNGDTTLR